MTDDKNRIARVSAAKGEYPAPAAAPAPWKPIVGAVGVIAGTIGGLLPAPFGAALAVLGWGACAIAGIAAAPPKWTEGKPLLGNAAVGVTTAMLPATLAIADSLEGWPKIAAQFVAMLATLGAGKASPQFGGIAK